MLGGGHRPRLGGAARRLARHRQVHADGDGARQPRPRGPRRLYVTGEESAAQVKLRAERLPEGALDVPVLAETDLGTVLATLEAEKPDVCVIDRVQTLWPAS